MTLQKHTALATTLVHAKNIRLQHSVPDDDQGGVSNALSHGNSKSSAADMLLHCLGPFNLLCNQIKSLLDCNKLSTLVSRAATRARSLGALQTCPGLTAYVCNLGEGRTKLLGVFTVNQPLFPPMNVSYKDDV